MTVCFLISWFLLEFKWAKLPQIQRLSSGKRLSFLKPPLIRRPPPVCRSFMTLLHPLHCEWMWWCVPDAQKGACYLRLWSNRGGAEVPRHASIPLVYLTFPLRPKKRVSPQTRRHAPIFAIMSFVELQKTKQHAGISESVKTRLENKKKSKQTKEWIWWGPRIHGVIYLQKKLYIWVSYKRGTYQFCLGLHNNAVPVLESPFH